MVLNSPKLGNGSFAVIKPAVIVLLNVPDGYDDDLIDNKGLSPNKMKI